MTTTAAATDDASPPPAGQPLAQHLAEVLLIIVVFFVVAGDPPPSVNESHYLCRLKHFWNPQWCAGDLFLESADTQVVLIWLFGWVTRWLSLSATAWVGRLLAWTLLAWAWQRLSWRLVPRPLAAVLSAVLFVTFNGQMDLAGEWVVGGVEAKCFGYGFVLLALYELIERRWNRLCLLLGAATACHPLVGGWSAVVCGGIWILEKVREKGDWSIFVKRPGRVLATQDENGPVPVFGLIGGGLLALVGIVPALALTWGEPADVVAEANRIYVFDRLPHHLALLTLPAAELARRLLRHGALLVALGGLTRVTIVLMKPAAALRRVAQFAWGAALLAALGLVIELIFWNQPLVAARLLRYYWFRLTDVAAPMAVALYATALIAAGLERRRAWAGWALTATLVLAGWHLADLAAIRVRNPVPPSDVKLSDYAAWVEACEWIAQHTPPDALFLTPRMNQSFKWRTSRPEVVNRKDIPQNTRGIVKWYRRLKDVYYYEDVAGTMVPIGSLGELGTERVGQLASRYSADFVLTERDQLLSLPVAFWNEEYVVYRIEDRGADDGQ